MCVRKFILIVRIVMLEENKCSQASSGWPEWIDRLLQQCTIKELVVTIIVLIKN